MPNMPWESAHLKTLRSHNQDVSDSWTSWFWEPVCSARPNLTGHLGPSVKRSLIHTDSLLINYWQQQPPHFLHLYLSVPQYESAHNCNIPHFTIFQGTIDHISPSTAFLLKALDCTITARHLISFGLKISYSWRNQTRQAKMAWSLICSHLMLTVVTADMVRLCKALIRALHLWAKHEEYIRRNGHNKLSIMCSTFYGYVKFSFSILFIYLFIYFTMLGEQIVAYPSSFQWLILTPKIGN